MAKQKRGTRSFHFDAPPILTAWASVAGKKESEGPLQAYFDYTNGDTYFGEKTWEKAECHMQEIALETLLQKAGKKQKDVDLVFSGDLLNQCISSSFAARDQKCPFFGLYGACSTMGEGLALAAMTLDGGFGQRAGVVVSSHFCTAERQYRTPLEYGSQRTPTAQWTVTAAGAVLLSREGPGPYLTHVTPGRVVDKGVTDTNNMGAAMAPAAYDTIRAHLQDTGREPGFYDLIITGDLGQLGGELLRELFQQDGVDLSPRYADCGLMIFDLERQDVHCGGSGCGCSAAVFNGYLLRGLREGRWKRLLFAPTGALLSPTSSFQGESIPGICHAVALSAAKEGV